MATTAGGPGSAVHRTIVVVDVEGFGDPRRTLPHQLGTRAGLYRVVEEALRAAGVAWEDCYHEDRGDCVFVLVPPDFPKGPLVEVVPGALVAALRTHNDACPPEQRVRLRVAVHAGEVAFDGHGATSTALTTAFRLIDAAPLKRALAGSPGVLALVVSRWVFDEVVRNSAVLDPTTFRPAPVSVKETRDTAWIALPDHPYPADRAAADHAAPDPASAPHQLPAPPSPFVGRREELDRLDAAVANSSTVVVSAIAGAGGIGKTWLALNWSHRDLGRFPDGQLFVDLRGFSPDGEPMDPAVAVRGFLDALGVDPGRIPVDPHAQAALFRGLVGDRRMLLVLDNAADTAQVTPLLPGGDTCTVLVTSRRRLAGLITAHDAHHLPLDVLADDEARALLTHRLDPGRLAAEPAAVAELIALCGGFPLALSIVAAHAHTRPQLTLTALAAELRDLGLDALDDDDPTASLPTVLSWSLRSLTPDQATALALLGIAPGPDIGLPAAASLTGLPPGTARAVLRGLVQASLIGEDARGHHRMHDLIRRHAADTAATLPRRTRDEALRRVVDHYLHTAHAADRHLMADRVPAELDPPEPGTHLNPPTDYAAALAWFDAEHPNLLVAQRTAAATGRHRAAWGLAWALTTFHHRRGHLHDRLAVWRIGLAAAECLPDPVARTLAHRYSGRACADLGRYDEAEEHLRQVLVLAERAGDADRQARAHQEFTRLWALRGDNAKALEHATHALRLQRALDDRVGEALSLNLVGWYEALLGDYDRAREHCRAALALQREHHAREGEAMSLDSLGYVDHRTGHHDRAVEHYRQALAVFRELGHSYAEADSLEGLGHPYAALGRVDRAREVWRQAWELYRGQGRDAEAEGVRRRLDGLDHPDGPDGHDDPDGHDSAHHGDPDDQCAPR
ncbi:ATP-binding protein [Saccharothrix lopnurensis]|uniref:ATP-binding protein n=1 Tax=Saccharothrix lopnurensis TaxID=1670621 RepID=A0ABW1PDT2_9PSEU